MTGRVNLRESLILEVASASPARTERIGRRLGELARPGDVFCLRGPLGAGKTVLARGLARGLGVKGGIVSPSFTLIHEHSTRSGLTLYHVDLYRLSPEAVAELGLEECLERGGVMVIEWSERLPAGLLGGRLEVELAFGSAPGRSPLRRAGERERRLTFRPLGERALELLEAARIALAGD